MKRIFIIFFVFLCQFINSCLFASQSDHVFASQAQLSIQPSSLTKSSSPLSLLITFTPSLEFQESNFILTPDPDWILFSQSDSYTTSTQNLPNDILAWPGMGTALQINNGSITFPSSDLQVGEKYGFFLTGGVLNNPISLANREYIWIGKTTQGDNIFESVPVSIPLLNSGQITVHGQVLPRQEDLSLKLFASHSIVNQETVITYTIEYENLSSTSTPIKIEADWNRNQDAKNLINNLFD